MMSEALEGVSMVYPSSLVHLQSLRWGFIRDLARPPLARPSNPFYSAICSALLFSSISPMIAQGSIISYLALLRRSFWVTHR